MAVDSARSVPVEFLKNISTVVVAYDRDDAGNEMARAIKQLLPGTIKMHPQALDWNQQLKEQQQQEEKRKQERGLEFD